MLTEVQEERILTWAAVLKSGTRQQGQGALHRRHYKNVQECCLGVACDIFKDEVGGQWQPFVKYDGTHDGAYNGPYDFVIPQKDSYDASLLPQEVADLFGLDLSGGVPRDSDDFGSIQYVYTIRNREFSNLAAANDNGVTFIEIGDALIEMVAWNREVRRARS